jgi:hypothetical protein
VTMSERQGRSGGRANVSRSEVRRTALLGALGRRKDGRNNPQSFRRLSERRRRVRLSSDVGGYVSKPETFSIVEAYCRADATPDNDDN